MGIFSTSLQIYATCLTLLDEELEESVLEIAPEVDGDRFFKKIGQNKPLSIFWVIFEKKAISIITIFILDPRAIRSIFIPLRRR